MGQRALDAPALQPAQKQPQRRLRASAAHTNTTTKRDKPSTKHKHMVNTNNTTTTTPSRTHPTGSPLGGGSPWGVSGLVWLPLCCSCSPCARVQWKACRFRLWRSCELRSRVVVAAVAFEPVAAPVRQAHVVPCEWITAARHWDDLVDLGTQRVWCAQCFVDWLPADRAHIICGEHPFAQLFPAPSVAVTGVGAHDGSPWLVV